MYRIKSIALILFTAAAFGPGIGCNREPAATPATQTQPAGADEREAVAALLKESLVQDADGLPAGHPPLDALAGPPEQPELPPGHPAFEPGAGSLKMLHYQAPETWRPQRPRGSMRKAQFVLPAADSESEDGELIVFYLGPGGGSVEGNIERWRAMFVTDDGRPVGDDAVRQETLEANGLTVTILDVTGNYRASVMPGAAPAEPQKDEYRLLAAIIETADGPWFVKAVGPADTMRTHRDNFMAFIRSVKH